MNQNEIDSAKNEIEELKAMIAEEEKKLKTAPIPSTIPLETQDVQFIPNPISPAQYAQAPMLKASNFITKAQGAFEVVKVLNKIRRMAIIGSISGLLVLMLAMFSFTFGIVGVMGVFVYFAFELFMSMRQRNYFKVNYGV